MNSEISKTPEQKEYMRRTMSETRENADALFREAKLRKKRELFVENNRAKVNKLIELLNVGTFDIEIASVMGFKVNALASFKKKVREGGVELPQRRGRRHKNERRPLRGVLDEE